MTLFKQQAQHQADLMALLETIGVMWSLKYPSPFLNGFTGDNQHLNCTQKLL